MRTGNGRYAGRALWAVVVGLGSASAWGTTFAVLLGVGSGSEGDSATVPVQFQSEGLSLTGLKITLPASALTRTVKLEIDTAPRLPRGMTQLAGRTWSFGITLIDPTTGAEISSFSDPVEICFTGVRSTMAIDKACLAYIDESQNPPKWVCEDAALKEKSPSNWCGTTDHFTVFALAEFAAVPEPSAAGIGLAAGAVLAGRRRRRA